MSIDIAVIGKTMMDAAGVSLGKDFPKVSDFLKSESEAMAQRLAMIAKLVENKSISDVRAKQHLEFQKNIYEMSLLAVKGLSQLAIENALNAALNAVKTVINNAIGFALL